MQPKQNNKNIMFSSKKRQTGRTSRMIEKAHHLARQGKSVCIIAYNTQDAMRILNIIGTPTHYKNITVISQNDLDNDNDNFPYSFDWETCKFSGNSFVALIDHRVFENKIASLLDHWTRYDIEERDELSESRPNPRPTEISF